MDKKEIIRILKDHETEIKNRFCVKRIGLFGSFSRDDSTENSDIDIVVEFEDGMATFKNFGGLAEYLENLFGKPVDILTPLGIESIRIDEIRESIKREIVYV